MANHFGAFKVWEDSKQPMFIKNSKIHKYLRAGSASFPRAERAA